MNYEKIAKKFDGKSTEFLKNQLNSTKGLHSKGVRKMRRGVKFTLRNREDKELIGLSERDMPDVDLRTAAIGSVVKSTHSYVIVKSSEGFALHNGNIDGFIPYAIKVEKTYKEAIENARKFANKVRKMFWEKCPGEKRDEFEEDDD